MQIDQPQSFLKEVTRQIWRQSVFWHGSHYMRKEWLPIKIFYEIREIPLEI